MSKLSSEKRNRLNDSDFGIPEKRMYPLHDKAHIESAVRLFGHAENKYKRSLARKILSRAREYNMDTSGWKQVLSFAQEQVPPMSNGTSIGNAPPRMMAPYYDEQDELLQRANSMDPNSKETMFDKAKRIVTMIHNKTEQDSQPPTGNQNCQLCTWCAEAQFRGINALPRPVYSPRDPALEIKGENIVIRPVRRSFTSQRDIVETVRGAVDSRWYVHVNWAESTGGHEFLVVNLNDYAYIMDAQAGLLKEIDESDSSHNYFRDINFRNSYMVRLDDREFNTKLFNEMNDPSKILPWKNSLDIPYMRDNGMLAPGDDDDPRFRRVSVPSEEGTKYMKQDPELSQYWKELNKATTGEFLVDRETGEPIGHVFVHTNAKDKGFIFNLEVNPKYRRQGYGWILTDDAVRRLGGEDLTVDADNTPAINLYLQYGFTIYKKGQWHYDPPKDELWMKIDKSKLKPIQEGFMDNLKTIGSVVKKGVNDFLFPDESNKELKLEPYTGNVPYQLYAVTKDGTVTEATPLFKTKRDALIDYSWKKVENEVMRDTGLKRVYLRFEKGSDFYIPSSINCMTYVDYDERNDFIADNDSVDIDGYCTTINTVNIPKENIKTDGRLHITNLDSSDIFDNERFTCRFNVELRDYGKNYDNTKYAYESFTDEYAKRVNDEGKPVPEKCKCGGKISITLKGEPIYSCEVCGKYYGTVPCNVQEGVIGKVIVGGITIFALINLAIAVKDAIKEKRYEKNTPTDEKLLTSIEEFLTYYNDLEYKDFLTDTGIRYEYIHDTMEDFDGHLKTIIKYTTECINTESNCYKSNEKMFEEFLTECKTTRAALWDIVCKLDDHIKDYDVDEHCIDETAMKYRKHYKTLLDQLMKHIEKFLKTLQKTIDSKDVVQEGAFQDLKNGVNPYSDNLVFHVTPDKHVDGQVWKPRVPDYLDPYNPEDTGFEDNTTPRICFSTSIEGALNGITVNLQRQSPDTFDKMYVYVPEKPWKEYKHKTNKQLVKDKLVYDANVTREVWIMEPVRMKLYGVIRVDQVADAKRKSVVPTSKGQKDTRNYFTYKWHWVVKPKVLKKATKFDYSPERVIDDLCIDIKKFKYGLIKDGRLQTGNVSDADYNKYWVFHSGETVDQAGGGNCYDMVEYEAGYLEAFGVPYKKYFMNFTNTKNTKTINTHTICVVPHNGKFIYIEQAFKRIVDEWGYERKKVFDKLNDIFEYVAEVTAEYENQDLNYGVWDYTDAEIDYGTPIKNFQEWIFNNCTMIHDGEAFKKKPTVKKEGYTLNRFEDSSFVQEQTVAGWNAYDEGVYPVEMPDEPTADQKLLLEIVHHNIDLIVWLTEKFIVPYCKEHGLEQKATDTALKLMSDGDTDIHDWMNNLDHPSYGWGWVYPAVKGTVDSDTSATITFDSTCEHALSTSKNYVKRPDDYVQFVFKFDLADDGRLTGQMITPEKYESIDCGKYDIGSIRDYNDEKENDFNIDKQLRQRLRDQIPNEIISFTTTLAKEERKTRRTTRLYKFKKDVFERVKSKYIDRNEIWFVRDVVEFAMSEIKSDVIYQKNEKLDMNKIDDYIRDLKSVVLANVGSMGDVYLAYNIKNGTIIEPWHGQQIATTWAQFVNMIEPISDNDESINEYSLDDIIMDENPIHHVSRFGTVTESAVEQNRVTEQKSTSDKNGGYTLNRFKSRFFQEEEEALSDTDDMEDITIGDLNLDDDDGDDEEKEEKISISDEELEDGGDASTEKEDDEDLSEDMELPGYMKERMSEDDVESFEQADENLNADNVDLGQFGKDQSDVQNDYDQKEIDILMKLMASEADAMNEYMDGAKETNVDVLRRLYADIANEERFHMEQLLFAKSELTGEKYQPRDPEVKSEYEELLKMGMDEETAMQTAVDKCHIRGSITEDDGEKMVEIQQDVETMEMAISMFNAQFDNVLMMMESKSFKKEDVEHAVDVFVEACCVQEEVYNVNTDKDKGGYLNQGKASANPIDILRKGLGFILRVLRTLITKFVEFLKRVRNHSRAIRTYVKRYGIEGIFASSKETTKMYFIDLDAPACINDSAETLLALTVDTYNACARSAGFQQQLPIGNLKRDSRFNIGGNIDKGIQILNGVQLIKTKMVIPKDKQKQEEIAACLFGYNEQRVTDSGESYNTLNRLKVMSDTWSAVLNGVNKQLEQMNTLRTQQGSIYYNNRKKYDLVIKGFETIIKTGKGVVTALQNDMNAIMKLNNEAMNISIQKTQQQDQDRMDKTPQLKQWNQNYKQNVDKGLK